MKTVKTLITTRFRMFRTFGIWFETSVVLLVWVLVFQEGSNPFQTTVRELLPNTFTKWSTKSFYQKLVDKIAPF